MISPELLRRYPYFAGVDAERLVVLARMAQEVTAAADEVFFREGDTLDRFYIVIEGEVAIVTDLPNKDRQIVVSTVGPGEVFAWSGLVPPHLATSSARAVTQCRVIAFDCNKMRARFDEDNALGYVMMQRLAQVMGDRIRDMHIEALSSLAE
jgi:CRP/FNR family cyclic AMP-dependent transcriptional regulator